MSTHHTVLLTAGVLVAALGSSLSAAVAQADRLAPSIIGATSDTKPDRAGTNAPGEDAKPTAPSSRVRIAGQDRPGRSGTSQVHGGAGGSAGKPAAITSPDRGARIAGAGKSGSNGNGDPGAFPNLDIAIDAGERIVIRDLDTDRVIIDTRDTALWSKFGANKWQKQQNWAVPKTSIEQRPGGVDIVFRFENNTSTPALLGEFRMPGMNLPGTIETRNFYLDASETTLTRSGPANKHWYSRHYSYPSQLYAPVMLLGDDDYSIGVSLNYPVTEFQHAVRTQYMSVVYPGDQGTAWLARFRTDYAYTMDGEWEMRGRLQPGESRTYTMSVRIVKERAGDHPNRWLQAFTPYRDFFRSTYGGVQYQRDPRPIQLLSMANRNQNNNREQNPRSYNFSGTRAPDRFGFTPWADYMRDRMDAGVERFNLVGISGAMWEHEHLNAPFLVATPFLNEPALAMARNSLDELRSLQSDGANIGFWWGRSAQVMFGWDTGQVAVLDPSNPAHIKAARDEIAAARQMGASTMGLDAFKNMSTWDAYGYLKEIRAENPDMDFVIEPMPADVLHTLAPGFLFVNRPKGQEDFAAEEPHVFADFLLPGHEIWGNIRSTPFYEQGLAVKGAGVPDPVLRAAAEKAAANGYSPVIFGEPDIRNWDIDAKDSWKSSVPADLH